MAFSSSCHGGDTDPALRKRPGTNLPVRLRLLHEQLCGNTAVVRTVLMTSEQCLFGSLTGERGIVCWGFFFKVSSTYQLGSKQSLKK